jgi:spore coat polysaccharide biosynthesis protein SpsF
MEFEKTGAIIQARICSTRLPGKTLFKLPFASDTTSLEQIIRRVKKCIKIGQIILATSINRSDDIIEAFSKKLGVVFFRGNEDNVLERYYLCAQKYNIKHIVRLCGDSPFIDNKLIDQYLTIHLEHNNDYTGTMNFPIGTNTEIFSFDALEKAYKDSKEKTEQEHVTPFIRNNTSLFKIEYCDAEGIYHKPKMRLTIDTKEDYTLACAIYDNFKQDQLFSLIDTINLLEKKPWMVSINENIIQRKIFNNLDEELAELHKIAISQNLSRAAGYIESIRNN